MTSLFTRDPHMGVCTNCGHTPDARCSKCLRLFCCGDAAGRCPRDDCNEGIMNHVVDQEYAQWLGKFYSSFPDKEADAKHLEAPRSDADYPLRSEEYPDASYDPTAL